MLPAMPALRAFCLLLCFVSFGCAMQAQSAAGDAAPKPKRVSCGIRSTPVSAAEAALSRDEYGKALELYRAMDKDQPAASREGVIRTLLAQDKVTEARGLAEEWLKREPDTSEAAVAMAEADLRAGNLLASYKAARALMTVNPCNARVYLVAATYEDLSAYFALGKGHIETAHKLDSIDPEIQSAWIGTLPRAQRLKEYAALAQNKDLVSDKDRAQMADYLSHADNYRKENCSVAKTVEEATIPMQIILDGPQNPVGIALDVQFNGKRRRLEIDTGAGGLVLSRSAASSLGLLREQKIQSGGIGDNGEVATSIAHVETLRIGAVEFHNCEVEILEKSSALDIDGLIGGNVFSKFLVTLDYPKMQLRLDPLPKRPDEAAKPAEALATAPARPEQTAEGAEEDSVEVPRHDRYVAPEMKTWTPIYRSGHDLLLPVHLGDTKNALFIVDTGAAVMLISPTTAREITKVHGSGEGIHGISGEVKKVYDTGKFTLSFANLAQHVDHMTAVDTSRFSHEDGVEISGFLGAPILFRLAVHIDYRDNLIKFDYDPKHDGPNR